MDEALLFQNGEKILVKAAEVLEGRYDYHGNQFVDPEYEFRVSFVKAAKGQGKPYFRLYYSYADYKRLFPDRADRYKIVANMRRYDESRWHKHWKELFRPFCTIEKYIKNPTTNQWKFADAFYASTHTCIEFQHSYIAFVYEERNAFYNALGVNTIWLYDLTEATIRDENGIIEILEDNSKGFFRVSEKPENLKTHPVYIQVKGGLIYRVHELLRREINSELKSSIRYFIPSEVFTEEEFVLAVKEEHIHAKSTKNDKLSYLYELWKPEFTCMVVQRDGEEAQLLFNAVRHGEMYRSYKDNMLQYKYVTCHEENGVIKFIVNLNKDYSLSPAKESSRSWRIITYKERQG